MMDAFEDHEGTIIMEARSITKLHLDNEINGLAGEEEERVKLAEHLIKASLT